MDFFNFSQVDSDISVWLLLDGKEYEVSVFDIQFGQGVDRKGQPQDEIRGGRMLVTLNQALPAGIYRWAMKSEPKDGEVVVRSRTASAPLKVKFLNTYCVSLDRHVGGMSGLQTALYLSPDEIYINGISFDNHWL
jgi:hypothetical protein